MRRLFFFFFEAAFLIVEHRLHGYELSSCGLLALLLHDMWDLPRPGLEPMSPALVGGFLTIGPPGKSLGNVTLKDG